MQILKQKNGTETCKNKGGKNSTTQLTFCHGKSYHEIEYDKSNKILLVSQPSFKCVLCDCLLLQKPSKISKTMYDITVRLWEEGKFGNLF